MWPWGHAAVAYLCYAGLVEYAEGSFATADSPGEGQALAVLAGSQVPDLVDKPLAWTLAVLAHGRSLAHSLLLAVPAVGLLWLALEDRRPLAAAFGVGWLSHPFADAVYPALDGEVAALGYLLWPLTEPAPAEIGQSFLAHLRVLDLGPHFAFEAGLAVAALLVWHRDGHPGLATVRSVLSGNILGLAQ